MHFDASYSASDFLGNLCQLQSFVVAQHEDRPLGGGQHLQRASNTGVNLLGPDLLAGVGRRGLDRGMFACRNKGFVEPFVPVPASAPRVINGLIRRQTKQPSKKSTRGLPRSDLVKRFQQRFLCHIKRVFTVSGDPIGYRVDPALMAADELLESLAVAALYGPGKFLVARNRTVLMLVNLHLHNESYRGKVYTGTAHNLETAVEHNEIHVMRGRCGQRGHSPIGLL